MVQKSWSGEWKVKKSISSTNLLIYLTDLVLGSVLKRHGGLLTVEGIFQFREAVISYLADDVQAEVKP